MARSASAFCGWRSARRTISGISSRHRSASGWHDLDDVASRVVHVQLALAARELEDRLAARRAREHAGARGPAVDGSEVVDLQREMPRARLCWVGLGEMELQRSGSQPDDRRAERRSGDALEAEALRVEANRRVEVIDADAHMIQTAPGHERPIVCLPSRELSPRLFRGRGREAHLQLRVDDPRECSLAAVGHPAALGRVPQPASSDEPARSEVLEAEDDRVIDTVARRLHRLEDVALATQGQDAGRVAPKLDISASSESSRPMSRRASAAIIDW